MSPSKILILGSGGVNNMVIRMFQLHQCMCNSLSTDVVHKLSSGVDIAIESTIRWPSNLFPTYSMCNSWHSRLHWSRFRKLLGNNHKVILTRSKFDNSTEPYSFKPIPTEDIRPAFFSLIADRSVETAWDVAVCWFVERFNKEWELPFDTPVSDLHMKHKAHYIL